MNKDQFEREKINQASMNMFQTMLQNGLITEERKIRPRIGCPYLFAAKCALARRISAECYRVSFKSFNSLSVIGILLLYFSIL